MRFTSPSPWTVALLVVAIAALAPGCKSSDETPPEPPPEPVTGVLGGLPFTVVSGAIVQDGVDQPIDFDATGAVLVFDDSLTVLAPDPENVRAIVTLTVPDGGQIVVGAYGTAGGLAAANAIGATRSGSTFDYSFYYGLDAEPDETGAFFSNPVNPDTTLYYRAEFQTNPSFDLFGWTPWDSLPDDCTGGPVGASVGPPGGTGAGSRLGLFAKGVTVEDISIILGDFGGC